MKPSRFALYASKPEKNQEWMNKLSSALLRAGFSVDEDNPELIIAFGGDGSLMRAIHKYHYKGKFILFNTGHLGFYSDLKMKDIDAFIDCILHEEPDVERLPIYEMRTDGKRHGFINDIAIQSGETCFFSIAVNGELLSKVRCNGIVISTPIGTTGYLTSLGSPVCIGNPQVYQYSTIATCYNRYSTNPINKAILENKQKLTITVEDGNIECFVDGTRRKDTDGIVYTFCKEDDSAVEILRFRRVSYVKKLRYNISGLED